MRYACRNDVPAGCCSGRWNCRCHCLVVYCGIAAGDDLRVYAIAHDNVSASSSAIELLSTSASGPSCIVQNNTCTCCSEVCTCMDVGGIVQQVQDARVIERNQVVVRSSHRPNRHKTSPSGDTVCSSKPRARRHQNRRSHREACPQASLRPTSHVVTFSVCFRERTLQKCTACGASPCDRPLHRMRRRQSMKLLGGI